jgi:predicted RNA methylase
MITIETERDLIALALALLPVRLTLSIGEQAACKGIKRLTDDTLISIVRTSIIAGGDPLGDAFARIRPSAVRRADGATYTPAPIIQSMMTWAASEGTPARVVDAGAGSGRFLLAAGLHFPKAHLIGVEYDSVAALLLRANLTVAGLMDRATVMVEDYRLAVLPPIKGKTLFIGNPPYVRHHLIKEDAKRWFADTAASFGVKASKLAGLHIHFYVRTLELARPGDYGAYITSSEWLDVNYGSTLRTLLANELGGIALHVLDPAVLPFADATTTGAIACFRVGHRPKQFRVRAVESLEQLNGLSAGRLVPWSTVEAANRWSIIIRPGAAVPAGYIELGELCRVHRGSVTGDNDIWIAGEHTKGLPVDVLTPTVTKARDLIRAGDTLTDKMDLRRVVDLPADLDELPASTRASVKRFLVWAKKHGADQSYTARNRRAWWSVGLKAPAPIMCTYMARRAPAFVRNLCDARHINIAHGLYPREALDDRQLDALAGWLRHNVGVESGRTYAGGLTKFEPKEIERIQVPKLEQLIA